MTVTTKIDLKTLQSLVKKYQKYSKEIDNDYAIFFASFKDCTITVFKNKKDKLTLTISGKDENIKSILKALKINSVDVEKGVNSTVDAPLLGKFNYDQIGSDEVGTGDFFGPIIVVAALIKSKDLKGIKKLGVTDSKKISDEKIIEIGKIVTKKYKYASLTLSNEKFNEVTNKGFNMNKIKCYLHNKALFSLASKNPEIKHIYVDQFVSRDKYYEYLKEEKNIQKNIFFHTKGETYFPSVALASVIARYLFLINMDKLNKKYKTIFPLGASNAVEKYANKFIEKYGIKEFDKLVKKNFSTYKRVVDKYTNISLI